jgi:hypothetical protein
MKLLQSPPGLAIQPQDRYSLTSSFLAAMQPLALLAIVAQLIDD